MDEIIQILIFVGAMVIMVVQQNVKSKKKPETTPSPAGEILEDIFPELKQATTQQAPPAKPQKKSAPRKKPARAFTQPSAETPKPTPPTSSAPRIRLNNREEAKRAFIYSEIFNRKY
ncbi:MAG: hypothetical protein IJD32_05395 [Bacteroidaceae bacterium]|nr:hypothetical protein [Bacteroidaceae bacterium]